MHGQTAEDNQKAIFLEFRRLASLSFEEGQKEAKKKEVMQQLPQLFNEEQLTEVLLQYFICFCTVSAKDNPEPDAVVMDHDTAALNCHAQLAAMETAARVVDFEASQQRVYANVKVYGQPEPEEGEYANDSVARGSGEGSAAAPTLEDVLRRDKQLKNPPSKVQKELEGDIAKVWWHSGGRQ